MRQQNGVVADLDILVDYDIRSDVSTVSNPRRGMDDCGGMHSWRIALRLVEQFECVGEAEIGILHAQGRDRDNRKVLGDDDGCGFGEPGGGSVFWVGDESDFSGAGLLDAVEAGDFRVGRSVGEACVEGGGDLCKFHGGWDRRE